jgi:hypothetical protein
MKTIWIALMASATVGFLGIALAAGPEAALQVADSRVRVSGDHAVVTVTLLNTQRKTVTAWGQYVEGRYADGSKQNNYLVLDDITALLRGNPEDRTFRTSTTRNLDVALPLDANGAPPVTVTASLKMVVFDDRSAVGDGREIDRLAATRKSMAASWSATIDDIERIRSRPDPKAAMREYIIVHPQGGAMLGQLLPLFDAGPAAVDSVVSMYKETRDLLLQHSVLTASKEEGN